MSFKNIKKTILEKLDKSRAQEIDKQISPLIKKINKSKDYFTTSSCAGRIMIIEKQEKAKRHEYNWLFSSHEPITLNQLKPILNKPTKHITWFQMEAPILHVAAENLEAAKKLLDFARKLGLKHSGILSMTRSKNIIEIIDKNYISFPLFQNNELLVTEDYLKNIIKLSNNKLKSSRTRFNKLKSFF